MGYVFSLDKRSTAVLAVCVLLIGIAIFGAGFLIGLEYGYRTALTRFSSRNAEALSKNQPPLPAPPPAPPAYAGPAGPKVQAAPEPLAEAPVRK